MQSWLFEINKSYKYNMELAFDIHLDKHHSILSVALWIQWYIAQVQRSVHVAGLVGVNVINIHLY